MFGSGKSNALEQAYLAGLQGQTSVYAATIPVYYGRTRGNLLEVWFNNLRKGHGLTTGKKAKGKNNFVGNVDFLIGHNPISGVLQFWYNQTFLSFGFEKLASVTPSSIGNASLDYTVLDADFYFIIGVTANVAYDVTFDDYGGQGPIEQSGTYELPLWNSSYAGPDPTNQNGYRVWPAVYQWTPYSGPTINFPGEALDLVPNWDGTINVYYAKLTPNTWRLGSGDVPVAALRLAFESILGSGTEYAPKPDQQILYPMYAGLESSNLDMGGGGGSAAAILPEVMGMFTVNPSGDADFADMIEDIFKSGPAQAGTGGPDAYGTIHHGLGCLDFPGTIQKKVGIGNSLASLTYDLPNTAPNPLIVVATQTGAGTLGISDTAGNSWTDELAPGKSGVWDAFAIAEQSNTVSISGPNTGMEIAMLEIGGLDTMDGSAVVASGTGGTYKASIPTTNLPGEDALIISIVICSGTCGPASFHWKNAITLPRIQIDVRSTKYPGSYSVEYPAFAGGVTWTGVLIAYKNSQPNSFTLPLGDILDDTSMQLARQQCRAYGLNGSLFMGAQKKASEWLEEIARAANVAFVWSGDKLKTIPYAEQSFAGNGSIYISPTSTGPVAEFSIDDFIADPGETPVTVERSAQVDAPNLQQIQFPNRDSNYDHNLVAQPDNGSMTLYGTRKEDPKVYTSIQTTRVALMILAIMIREANLVRNTYAGKLQPRWALLEALDLVTMPLLATMPVLDNNYPPSNCTVPFPLRMTSVELDEKFAVTFEAEPFVYGMRSPIAQEASIPAPYAPPLIVNPGSINAPIIFEAVPSLFGQGNAAQLWIVTSGSSADYGGCVAYISTDGGLSYNLFGPNSGVIQGSATQGFTVGDWPPHATPDTTNDLSVDLTESLGTLDSYQVADEDNFVFPCFVDGGGGNPITYELMTYAVANLTAAHKYTLKATGGGNHLNRGVFGAPLDGVGVDHPNNSRFAFLDPTNQNAPGIISAPLLPTWIGVTLKFKFPAFNANGGGSQTLAEATVYTYTPTGAPGGVNPDGIPPQVFLVNGT